MSQLKAAKVTEYIKSNQQGGILSMDELKKRLAKPTTQQDNTTTIKPTTEQPELAMKDQFGRTIPKPTNQGEITATPTKSLREKAMSTLNYLDRDGKNMVAGIVTDPAKAGLRLLRPDKYFNGVRNDADIPKALGSLGMDALMVAPAVNEAGELLGKGSVLAENASRADRVWNTPAMLRKQKPLLRESEDWINNWKNDPIIQRRIQENNNDILFRGSFNDRVGQIDPTMKLTSEHTHPMHQAAVEVSVGGPVNGHYNPIGSNQNFTGDPGKAYVSPYLSDEQAKTTATHEMTHQLTDGDRLLSVPNQHLLRSPFGGRVGIGRLMDANPDQKTQEWIDYLTKPTEVHARINQLRQTYSIPPAYKMDARGAAGVISDVEAGRTPVTPHFGLLMNNPQALADVFNKMFTPAVVAGAGVAAYKSN